MTEYLSLEPIVLNGTTSSTGSMRHRKCGESEEECDADNCTTDKHVGASDSSTFQHSSMNYLTKSRSGGKTRSRVLPFVVISLVLFLRVVVLLSNSKMSLSSARIGIT